MSQEQKIFTDFNQVTRNYWTTHSNYDKVSVLLLCWVDDDLNVMPEVLRLQELFQNDFGFEARIYHIPSDKAQVSLLHVLATFIWQKSIERRSLTIVYYAGHADNATEKSEAGYSEWRPKQNDDGETVNWFELQPCLYSAQGDVLVILDCCHAAHKTRERKQGKMEILAACGSGSRVPEPGRLSFTSVLIRQIRKRLKSGEPFNVKWLHSHLWGDKTQPGLTVTPVYFDLSEQDQRSIVLKPLQDPEPVGFCRKRKPASSFIFLKVSLEDDPTGLQIANWLKSFPLDVIRDVDIEGLVLKARRLEGLKDHATFFPGSILGKISSSAQSEILHRVWGLTRVISNTVALADEAEAIVNQDPTEGATQSELAGNVINDIRSKIADVCDSIEGGVLLDPNIKLDDAVKDEAVIAADAENTIRLRQYLLNTSPTLDNSGLLVDSIKFSSLHPRTATKSRFRYGTTKGKSVIVESFQYTAAKGSSDASPSTTWQLRRMIAQLSHPKRASFHILPCVGYIQERHVKRFGVVFNVDENVKVDELPVSLCDVFPPIKKRVPLGLRLHLAHALAIALGSLHRVGWVHKEFKSENILFFKGKEDEFASEEAHSALAKSTDVDFTQPYLFGFECSRPEDAETYLNTDYSPKNNAYRHPERWGKPSIKFEKAHDVYALGIVYLELAFWKSALKFESMRAEKIDPWAIKEELLATAKKDLPHIVGQSFTDAIIACLEFKELTQGFDESRLYQEYKVKILEVLKKAAANV